MRYLPSEQPRGRARADVGSPMPALDLKVVSALVPLGALMAERHGGLMRFQVRQRLTPRMSET